MVRKCARNHRALKAALVEQVRSLYICRRLVPVDVSNLQWGRSHYSTSSSRRELDVWHRRGDIEHTRQLRSCRRSVPCSRDP